MTAILLELWKRIKLIGYFLFDNWKYTLPAILLILLVLFAWKSCGKKEIKLDQKAIIEAQQAIEANDRQKMVEVLATSDAKEAVADETAANASAVTVNVIKESKDKWNAASDEAIRAELERRAKQ